MATSSTCPKCGSSAVFHSRHRRKDGLRRLLFYSALRCHACGHRYFSINFISPTAIAVALLALAVLIPAAFIGLGNVSWLHHAQTQTPPLVSAHALTGKP